MIAIGVVIVLVLRCVIVVLVQSINQACVQDVGNAAAACAADGDGADDSGCCSACGHTVVVAGCGECVREVCNNAALHFFFFSVAVRSTR